MNSTLRWNAVNYEYTLLGNPERLSKQPTIHCKILNNNIEFICR